MDNIIKFPSKEVSVESSIDKRVRMRLDSIKKTVGRINTLMEEMKEISKNAR